jgi:hypothetical protein
MYWALIELREKLFVRCLERGMRSPDSFCLPYPQLHQPLRALFHGQGCATRFQKAFWPAIFFNPQVIYSGLSYQSRHQGAHSDNQARQDPIHCFKVTRVVGVEVDLY